MGLLSFVKEKIGGSMSKMSGTEKRCKGIIEGYLEEARHALADNSEVSLEKSDAMYYPLGNLVFKMNIFINHILELAENNTYLCILSNTDLIDLAKNTQILMSILYKIKYWGEK